METKSKDLQKQPKILKLAFITAMSERFGYYIIGFMLVLYAKHFYNLDDKAAFALFALFTALGYLTPTIGGYLADNIVGIKRCLGIGLLCEAVGYYLLAMHNSNPMIFNIAMGTIIVGAGIFKTAPTNMLGRAYKPNDPRIDSGFTLFYMGINVGSFSSGIVSGSLLKLYGWHMPFLVAGIGLRKCNNIN